MEGNAIGQCKQACQLSFAGARSSMKREVDRRRTDPCRVNTRTPLAEMTALAVFAACFCLIVYLDVVTSQQPQQRAT
jgi:hypothetical protein